MATNLVSVIIPVRNGATSIGACLEAIYRSSYPELEAIVVDDASQDNTLAIISRFPCQVLHWEEGVGPARARNLGSQKARGDILFFTDSDVTILPETIERAVRILENDHRWAAVIGSYTKETPAQNFVSRYKNFLHHYTHQRSAGEVASFFTACGAIRKPIFDALGGFDESITTTALEDVELGYRLSLQGYRVLLDGTVQISHLKHYTLRGLLRSDLFGRAIPYAKRMLKHRIFKGELSTGRHNVVSVFLIFLLLVVVGWGLISGSYMVGSTLAFFIVAMLVILNGGFYTFLWREAGLFFALGGLVMHWWGYLYSGVGLVMGIASYSLEGISPKKGKIRLLKDV